jgi:hypothetical protein
MAENTGYVFFLHKKNTELTSVSLQITVEIELNAVAIFFLIFSIEKIISINFHNLKVLYNDKPQNNPEIKNITDYLVFLPKFFQKEILPL